MDLCKLCKVSDKKNAILLQKLNALLKRIFDIQDQYQNVMFRSGNSLNERGEVRKC